MAPPWSQFERAILFEVRDRLAAGGTPSAQYTYERIGRYLGRVVNDNGKSPVAQVQYERSQKRRLDPSQSWTEPQLPLGWSIGEFLREGATFEEWMIKNPAPGQGGYPLGSEAVKDAAKKRQRRERASAKTNADAKLRINTPASKAKYGDDVAVTTPSILKRQHTDGPTTDAKASERPKTPQRPVERMTTRSIHASLGGKSTQSANARHKGTAQMKSTHCDKTEAALPASHPPSTAEKTLDGVTDSSAFLIGVDILNPYSDSAHDVMQSIHEKFTPASPNHPHVDLGNDHVLPPITGWELYARNRETYGKRLRPRFMVMVAMEQLRTPSVLYASRIPRALAAANRIMQGADAGEEVDLALKKELDGASNQVFHSKASDVGQINKEVAAALHTPMHSPDHPGRKRKMADEPLDIAPMKQKFRSI